MMDENIFLKKLNGNLITLELELQRDVSENYVNIFLLGLPRAGTTLLSQVIFNNLEISCTNNLMAKFWMTPLVGCYLSKLTIGNFRSNSYTSDYGKTFEIYSPHEFSWFWNKVLNIKNIENYNPELEDANIDWNYLRQKLLNLNEITGTCFVHKTLEFTAYHSDRFNTLLKKAIFVYINRPLTDIALSLTQARLERFNDLNKWWSSYPPEFQKLKDKEFDEQIAGQVYYLDKMYKERLKYISPQRLIKLSYRELCNNPQQLLYEIISKSKDLGCEIKQINNPPIFTPIIRNQKEVHFIKVKKALERLVKNQK